MIMWAYTVLRAGDAMSCNLGGGGGQTGWPVFKFVSLDGSAQSRMKQDNSERSA